MKISEFIAKLEKAKAMFGDVDTCIVDNGQECTPMILHYEKSKSLTIIDEDQYGLFEDNPKYAVVK